MKNHMYPMFSIWVIHIYIYNWCMIVSTNDINGLERSQSLLLTIVEPGEGYVTCP